MPLIGLPPIINLLIDTLPILRRGRLPSDDFPAAKSVLADAAANDVVRDLLKNLRRVILFIIFVFLVIALHNPRQSGRSARRITDRLGEKHVLFRPELEFFGCVVCVASVEKSGEAL